MKGGNASGVRTSDPFDRLLAAQAILEGYTILSTDIAFDGLGAPRIW